ncbi:MAG: Sir2 family NAD-dependent protein deacetylase [Gemmatimonadaceae bacterium]
MSAESGVPTFRDALTGLWSRFRPEELATPEAYRADPRSGDWYRWRRELVDQAQPNAAHVALARLGWSRDGVTVVTQNVDGLHQRAGQPRLITLHGDLHHARCRA